MTRDIWTETTSDTPSEARADVRALRPGGATDASANRPGARESAAPRAGREVHVEDRFAGARTNLPGLGWWATLACVLAFVLATKTGTVDAPIEAKDRAREAERPAVDALGARLGPTFDARDAEEARLAGEVETLRTQLAVERRRAAVLARSVETLASRVDELAGPPAPSVDSAPLPAVPVPVDAIYVLPEGR